MLSSLIGGLATAGIILGIFIFAEIVLRIVAKVTDSEITIK